MGDYRTRIESLSDLQRQALAAMLGCESHGRQKLVAYVSPISGGDVPQAEEVQQFLRTKLPGYMVPSSVVVLD
ncbi:MAG: acyl-CoA synthetase (AMP-forming)/AMP-acid ligase II, partial [Verrucomicrobiales bacterium]